MSTKAITPYHGGSTPLRARCLHRVGRTIFPFYTANASVTIKKNLGFLFILVAGGFLHCLRTKQRLDRAVRVPVTNGHPSYFGARTLPDPPGNAMLTTGYPGIPGHSVFFSTFFLCVRIC